MTQSPRMGNVLFENTYGYYEARIKYPPIRGTWGAFWLMGITTYDRDPNYPAHLVDPVGGVDGTEIDIVEFFHNTMAHTTPGVGGTFNHALHWDGYGSNKGGTSRSQKTGTAIDRALWGGTTNQIPAGTVPTVYDGNFHVFALDWSPTEYVFYINGVMTARYNKSDNICRNPLYLKLSIEAADWASPWEGSGHVGLPEGFTSAFMEVDYVRVWNQPRSQVPNAGTGN